MSEMLDPRGGRRWTAALEHLTGKSGVGRQGVRRCRAAGDRRDGRASRPTPAPTTCAGAQDRDRRRSADQQRYEACRRRSTSAWRRWSADALTRRPSAPRSAATRGRCCSTASTSSRTTQDAFLAPRRGAARRVRGAGARARGSPGRGRPTTSCPARSERRGEPARSPRRPARRAQRRADRPARPAAPGRGRDPGRHHAGGGRDRPRRLDLRVLVAAIDKAAAR